MRTLTVEEAVTSLDQWLELALAGENIRIRRGDAEVELRPVNTAASAESLSPREALHCLQRDARLSPDQMRRYLREVAEERLASEDHQSR